MNVSRLLNEVRQELAALDAVFVRHLTLDVEHDLRSAATSLTVYDDLRRG